jgi:lipopolysaccharide core heptose(I) kinase
MIWVRPDLAPLFTGLAFEDWLALGQRTVKRSADGARHTAAFERGGRAFYVKAHAGVGWGEILKCWLQGKRAIVDAATEVRALERCAALGIPVPTLAAWGVVGRDPGSRRSFVVTEELDGAERASTLLARDPRPALRRALARRLGALVARLHGAGLAHRDLYLEHVFLRPLPGGELELYLLDLHRTLPAAPERARWRVKDLGALWGSAVRVGAARSDALRFLRAYAGDPPRLGPSERALWRAVARRAGR